MAAECGFGDAELAADCVDEIAGGAALGDLERELLLAGEDGAVVLLKLLGGGAPAPFFRVGAGLAADEAAMLGVEEQAAEGVDGLLGGGRGRRDSR